MEARPSPLVERIVSALLPSSRRDEVLGDLQERYGSTGRYLLDASSAVPLVVWSQIRRTSSLARLGAQATGMAGVLVLASAVLGPGLTLQLRFGWQLLLPVGIALLTIVLRDAYADAERSRSEQLADDSVGPMNALLAEYVLALVGAPLALPQSVVLIWTVSSLLMLGIVRALAPSRPSHRTVQSGGAARVREYSLNEAASIRGRMLWSELALMLGIWIHAFTAMDGIIFRLLQIFVALPAMIGVTFYKWYTDTSPVRSKAEPVELRQKLEAARDTMRYWSAWHRIATVTVITVPVLIWMLSLSAGRADLSGDAIWIGVIALWTRQFFVGHGLSRRAERAFQRALDNSADDAP